MFCPNLTLDVCTYYYRKHVLKTTLNIYILTLFEVRGHILPFNKYGLRLWRLTPLSNFFHLYHDLDDLFKKYDVEMDEPIQDENKFNNNHKNYIEI
jgi:hypothetical protein